MEKQKRNIRTYKATDKSYFAAQELCSEQFPLSQILETVVEEISKGSSFSVKLRKQLLKLRNNHQKLKP